MHQRGVYVQLTSASSSCRWKQEQKGKERNQTSTAENSVHTDYTVLFSEERTPTGLDHIMFTSLSFSKWLSQFWKYHGDVLEGPDQEINFHFTYWTWGFREHHLICETCEYSHYESLEEKYRCYSHPLGFCKHNHYSLHRGQKHSQYFFISETSQVTLVVKL